MAGWSEDKVYRKVGGGRRTRYVAIGHEWRGFPCDGFWYVRRNGCEATCLLPDTEIPRPPFGALFVRAHINGAVKHVQEMADKKGGYSLYEAAQWICDYLAAKAAAGAECEGEVKQARDSQQ